MALRQVFRAKRELFEQIRRLAAEDQGKDFMAGPTGSGNVGLPSDRLSQYQSLLGAIDRHASMYANSLGGFKIRFEGIETFVTASSWSNGITFVSGDPTQAGKIARNTEEIDLAQEGQFWLMPIENGWFIFHEDL